MKKWLNKKFLAKLHAYKVFVLAVYISNYILYFIFYIVIFFTSFPPGHTIHNIIFGSADPPPSRHLIRDVCCFNHQVSPNSSMHEQTYILMEHWNNATYNHMFLLFSRSLGIFVIGLRFEFYAETLIATLGEGIGTARTVRWMSKGPLGICLQQTPLFTTSANQQVFISLPGLRRNWKKSIRMEK